jgi:hypothetical protein
VDSSAGIRFEHRPPFTAFLLDGKHEMVACAGCHPEVTAEGAQVRRYKPLPTSCEGCYADFHRGAFEGLTP